MNYNILCTPNISEGRNKDVIETCASAISAVDGVILLDVDSSPTNNRTIFNFVGNPISIVEAALNLCRAAYNLIDISKHKGYQPRIGVISACPFVPLHNEDMARCIEVAMDFARQLADEVIAPVYIYGESVTDDDRKNMIEDLFSTEYEEMKDKILKEDLKPDFGVAEFVPQWGATLVGARKFLVYFNINLLGTREQAVHIGNRLEDIYNIMDENSKKEDIQCAGWFSDELNVAQISINIIDFDKTPIHEIYESAITIAKEVNANVIGSQLVGAVPLNLLMDTADVIMESSNLLILDEDQKIRLVIGKLGLNTISAFNPKEKVIEYVVEATEESSVGGVGGGCSAGVSLENALLNLSIADFVQAVAARNSTPGLGSVATLVALMGTSLATMNGLLSYGRCGDADIGQNQKLRKVIPQIYQTHKKLMSHIDRHALLAFEYSKISSLQTPELDKDKDMRKDMEIKSVQRCRECPRDTAEQLSHLWAPLLECTTAVDPTRRAEVVMAGKLVLAALEGLLCLAASYTNPSASSDDVDGKSTVDEIKKYVTEAREKMKELGN